MSACSDPDWLCWVEAHPALAGWFQAIFSVLAILAAIAVPLLLAWLDASRHKRRLHIAAFRASTAALATLGLLVDRIRGARVAGLHRLAVVPVGAIEANIAELEALPINTSDDLDLGRNVQFLLMSMRTARNSVKMAEEMDDAEIGSDVVGIFERIESSGRAEFVAIVKACTHLPPKLRRTALATASQPMTL